MGRVEGCETERRVFGASELPSEKEERGGSS
jgi:hypothetical protein